MDGQDMQDFLILVILDMHADFVRKM